MPTANGNNGSERRRGYWEGQIAQKLDDMNCKIDELRKDFVVFREDAYKQININGREIARQKGWIAGIGLLAGAIGAAIKSLVK